MTLPKKASRDIEVNGKTYRWMVKRVGPVKEGTARLTVEDPATGEVKQRMFRGSGWEGMEVHDPPRVTPGEVKGFILERF
jgi:hypothetical protein